MRVIVCGSRDWADALPIRLTLAAFENKDVTIVHGAARGADLLVGELAVEYRLDVESFPADWDGLGKRAGHVRNKQMLNSGAGLVVAFKDNFDHAFSSGGTEGMVKIAKAAGVPTLVVSHG